MTNAASNQQLDRCPFCGAGAFTSWDGDTNSPDDWSANCDNTLDCGASIGGMASEEAAIKAWNRRSRVSAGGVVATGGFACDCCGRNMEVRIDGKFCNECAGYRAATASPAAPKEES